MANMTIHFHASEKTGPENTIHGWNEIISAVDEIFQTIDNADDDKNLHTTQMGILHTALLMDGWTIIVHRSDDTEYEIALGKACGNSRRIIAQSHNLYKLWQAGEFD